MAEEYHIGYNTLLKAKTTAQGALKEFVGVTSDNFQRQANVKESITKADQGAKRKKATTIDDNWTVSGICGVDGTRISRFEIMQLVGQVIAVEYTISDDNGGGTVACNALVTGYSEDTPADPDTDPTYTLNLSKDGEITFTAAS